MSKFQDEDDFNDDARFSIDSGPVAPPESTSPDEYDAGTEPACKLHAGGTDWGPRLLVRLMHVHEARLARFVATAPARIALPSELVPATGQVTGLEAPTGTWDRPDRDDDFDLWEELERPSHPKSLRSMV